MLRLTDEELEESLRRDRQEALKETLPVRSRMHDTFESWFPFDENDGPEEREMYQDGFGRAQLDLTLGSSDVSLYDYLCSIRGLVEDNDEYYEAIEACIRWIYGEKDWI